MQAATHARAATNWLLRRDEDSTQARLMRRRGDLSKTAFSFNATLPPPGPSAREKGLGMDVVLSDGISGPHRASLVVADVDSDLRSSTPVAEWNLKESRQANRGAEEVHASLAIKPGDKICAVNGMHGDDTAMAELLASAADLDSPKAVNLTLERCRSDVLGPQDALSSNLPPRLPTRGTRLSIFQRSRSGSNGRADAADSSVRPRSVPYEAASSKEGRRGSEPAASTLSPLQWSSLLSPSHSQVRGRRKNVEDEVSTRSPSVSLSGRSSSASTCESGPPIVIQTTQKSQAFRNFARVGRATFS